MTTDLLEKLQRMSRLVDQLEKMMVESFDANEITTPKKVIKLNKAIEQTMEKISTEMSVIAPALESWEKESSKVPKETSQKIAEKVADIKKKQETLLKKASLRKDDVAAKRAIALDVMRKIKKSKQIFKGYRTTPRRPPRIIRTDV